MPETDINITYLPHQQELVDWLHEDYKFFILTKGRRFSLTHFMAYQFIEWSWANHFEYMLWVDVIHSNINRYVERFFMPILKQMPRRDWKWYKQDKILKICNSVIDLRSSDRPENIEGFGYGFIFVNEAGICFKVEGLLEHSLLPMLLDQDDSKLLAGGVPKGKTHKGKKHDFAKLIELARIGTEGYTIKEKTTYDNPVLSKEYIASMEATMDPLTARQELYGELIEKTGLLVMYCFAEHHKQELARIKDIPVYLSFDFNLNPFTCLIAQEGQYESGLKWAHFIDEIYLTKDKQIVGKTYIEMICEMVRVKYPEAVFRVTGDASSKKGEITQTVNVSAWTLVEKSLKIGHNQLVLPGKNPSLSRSIEACNAMLSHTERIEIRVDPEKCPQLIIDLETCKLTENGEIDKKESARTHMLDNFRYHLNTWHYDFIEFI